MRLGLRVGSVASFLPASKQTRIFVAHLPFLYLSPFPIIFCPAPRPTWAKAGIVGCCNAQDAEAPPGRSRQNMSLNSYTPHTSGGAEIRRARLQAGGLFRCHVGLPNPCCTRPSRPSLQVVLLARLIGTVGLTAERPWHVLARHIGAGRGQ
jgi:hypothetical protein